MAEIGAAIGTSRIRSGWMVGSLDIARSLENTVGHPPNSCPLPVPSYTRGMLRPVALLALALLAPPASAAETVRITIDEREGPITLEGANLTLGEDREDSAFLPLDRHAATLRRGARGQLQLD